MDDGCKHPSYKRHAARVFTYFGDGQMVLQLFQRARPKVVETKASATAGVVAFHGGGRAAWSPRDTVSLTRSGFIGNPVGFRCVKMIAEAAAALPFVLQDADRRYDVHPVLKLLAKPNNSQGGAALSLQ